MKIFRSSSVFARVIPPDTASRLHDEDQRVNSAGVHANNLNIALKSQQYVSLSGCYNFSGCLLGLKGIVRSFGKYNYSLSGG